MYASYTWNDHECLTVMLSCIAVVSENGEKKAVVHVSIKGSTSTINFTVPHTSAASDAE